MHRLTAKLLLLFALAGSILPLAQAATAPSAPECCRRAGMHHCNADSVSSTNAPESGQASFRAPGCCHGDCGRAVTTSQWAHLLAAANDISARIVEVSVAASSPRAPTTKRIQSLSTRAPPLLSIA
jgi:hypothetical protein